MESTEPNKQYRFLIVGGGGYVGFHIGLKLLTLKHQVVLYDLNCPLQKWASYKTIVTSSDKRLLTSFGAMEFIQGDVRNKETLITASENIDCVIHTVSYGMSGREQTEPYWDLMEDININGTRNVIEASVQNGVRGMVYTSTYNVVFGGQSIINGDESLPYYPLHRYVDHYSRTKSIAEQLVLANNGKGNFRSCALRLNGVFGRGEERHLPRTINYIRTGVISFCYFPDEHGSIVDFITIDNVVQGHVKAALKLCEPDSKLGGNAYFLSDGKPVNVIEFLRPIIEHLDKPLPKFRMPIWIMFFLAFVLEFIYKLVYKFFDFQPLLTRCEVYKSGVTHYFSIEKARRDFDYNPTRPNDLSEVIADLPENSKKKMLTR